MHNAYISLGSNINPRQNIAKALQLLSQNLKVTGISTVYRTRPELNRKQPSYFNCVVAVKTGLKPGALKSGLLKMIEKQLGRRRKSDKFASRTIDLDLIAYGRMKLKKAGMVLPDPDILRRPYLFAGLTELNYSVKFPEFSFSDILPLNEYTKFLRMEASKWKRTSQK